MRPSLENLRKQAKRRAKDASVTLSDAQHAVAREYGLRSWPELVSVVGQMNGTADPLADVKIEFAALVKAVDAGDVGAVRRMLDAGEYTQFDLDRGLAHACWYHRIGPWDRRRELADLLLSAGADPDGQYGSGYGPIVFGTGECLSVEGLEYLLIAGADVKAPPVETKYGPTCVLSAWLGGYDRARNDDKHRGLDLLLRHDPHLPAFVTPEMIAVHRGDVAALAGLLDADPALSRRSYPDMPYGNLSLAGATLLHLALDLGEGDCADLLVARGADLNARTPVVGNVGGQTPVFHAVGSMLGKVFPVLERFVRGHGPRIDWAVRCAGLRYCDGVTVPETLTPLDLALATRRSDWPDWRRGDPREPDLLRSAGAVASAPALPDRPFAEAVAALDAGDVRGLRVLLAAHPTLPAARAPEDGTFAGDYFKSAGLLWFVAENPVRTGRMPDNVAEVAAAIVEAGASREDVQYTLGLVCSGRVAREQGRVRELVAVLVGGGADPTAALPAAIGHGEGGAVHALLEAGARLTAPAAAATGDIAALAAQLPSLSADERLECLAAAVIHRRHDSARAVLAAGGFDVSAFLPPGMHPHSTALHQAEGNGDARMARLLVDAGARTDLPDRIFGGTPADWARYAAETRGREVESHRHEVETDPKS